jgi:hypothetical protein
MKFSSFATDLDLEETGVWVDFGDGASCKIARIGNSEYKRVMRELLKPWRNKIARKNVPDEEWIKITCSVLSKTILLDWKGWEDDKGKKIPYSEKNAYDMLHGLKDFRAQIEELAEEQATFALIADEETGND